MAEQDDVPLSLANRPDRTAGGILLDRESASRHRGPQKGHRCRLATGQALKADQPAQKLHIRQFVGGHAGPVLEFGEHAITH